LNEQDRNQEDFPPGPRRGQRSYEACLHAAFHYLSYRPRSEAEIRTQLQRRKFDGQFIEKVLLKLGEQGLVDDLAFARFWKDNREAFSPRSRTMLRQELSSKGVNVEIIVEVAREIDEESGAYRAAQRKAKVLATSDYTCFHQKLFGFLKRRGFSYEIIQHTVSQLWQEGKEDRQNA